MNEEQKRIFMTATSAIAEELIDLAKRFPEMGLVSVTAGNNGYFTAMTSNDDTIFDYSRTPGYDPDFREIDKREPIEEAS